MLLSMSTLQHGESEVSSFISLYQITSVLIDRDSRILCIIQYVYFYVLGLCKNDEKPVISFGAFFYH